MKHLCKACVREGTCGVAPNEIISSCGLFLVSPDPDDLNKAASRALAMYHEATLKNTCNGCDVEGTCNVRKHGLTEGCSIFRRSACPDVVPTALVTGNAAPKPPQVICTTCDKTPTCTSYATQVNHNRTAPCIDYRPLDVVTENYIMAAAMQQFVNRVEAGEVRSIKTYTHFKKILSDRAERLANRG